MYDNFQLFPIFCHMPLLGLLYNSIDKIIIKNPTKVFFLGLGEGGGAGMGGVWMRSSNQGKFLNFKIKLWFTIYEKIS